MSRGECSRPAGSFAQEA
eukprot:gene27327-biopygen17827